MRLPLTFCFVSLRTILFSFEAGMWVRGSAGASGSDEIKVSQPELDPVLLTLARNALLASNAAPACARRRLRRGGQLASNAAQS